MPPYQPDVESENAALRAGLSIYGYTLLGVLGKGGFGITYRARRESDGKEVVIKESLPRGCAYRPAGTLQVLPKSGMEGDAPGCFEWATDNFSREATTLQDLRHPNIVKVLDAFETDETGTAYYVMPLISEYSLQDYIRKDGVRDRKWVLYLLSSLLGALNYIHTLDIPLLHRDLKPENILIAEDGRPVLIDFGSAREADIDLKTRIVTHSFSPIEQSKGSGEGPWTDLYSLAATMYYLITGKLVPALDHRIPEEEDEYVPLASDPDLEGVYGAPVLESIDKALSFRAEARFQSALEWAMALEHDPHFQSSLVVFPPYDPKPRHRATVPMPGPFLTPEPSNKGRLLMVILFILLFLLALGGVGTYLYANKMWPFMEEKREADVRPVIKPIPVLPKPKPKPVVQAPARTVQLRVLAKPGSHLYVANGETLQEERIPVLAIYYVDSSQGESFSVDGEEFYRVCNSPGGKVCGALKKRDTLVWDTNLAMRLTHPGGRIQRDISLYYRDAAHAETYATSEKAQRDAIQKAAREKARPAEFAQALTEIPGEAAAGIIGREPLKWSKFGSSHLLPITGFCRDAETGRERSFVYNSDTTDESGRQVRRKTKAYRVAAMGRGTTSSKSKTETTTEATPKFKGVDIVFVVDTTQSMRPFIASIKQSIAAMVQKIEQGAENAEVPHEPGYVRFGIIGYRDSKFVDSDEGRVSVPTNWQRLAQDGDRSKVYVSRNFSSELLPAKEFMNLLASVETMGDGESTVGYTEDVLAGLNAALVGDDTGSKPAWREGSAKFVFLFGDAPGREPGEVEDARLCRDRDKPLGSWAGCNIATLKAKLAEKDIRLSTAFILTDQKGVRSKNAWADYERKGISQFRELAYMSYARDGKPLYNFMVFNKTGRAVPELESELRKGGLATDAELVNQVGNMSDEMVTEVFSREVIEPVINELLYYAEHPDEALTSGKLSPTQCMFADAYVEFIASATPAASNEEEEHPIVAESWMLDKDPNGNKGLESCTILTRRQFEKIVSILDKVLELQKNKDSAGGQNWGSLRNLMVATLADPNLIDRSDSLSDAEIEELLGRFPDSSTSILCKDLSELSDKEHDEIINDLTNKLQLLNELGKDASWVSDGSDTSLDFIAVPLDYLP